MYIHVYSKFCTRYNNTTSGPVCWDRSSVWNKNKLSSVDVETISCVFWKINLYFVDTAYIVYIANAQCHVKMAAVHLQNP